MCFPFFFFFQYCTAFHEGICICHCMQYSTPYAKYISLITETASPLMFMSVDIHPPAALTKGSWLAHEMNTSHCALSRRHIIFCALRLSYAVLMILEQTLRWSAFLLWNGDKLFWKVRVCAQREELQWCWGLNLLLLLWLLIFSPMHVQVQQQVVVVYRCLVHVIWLTFVCWVEWVQEKTTTSWEIFEFLHRRLKPIDPAIYSPIKLLPYSVLSLIQVYVCWALGNFCCPSKKAQGL